MDSTPQQSSYPPPTAGSFDGLPVKSCAQDVVPIIATAVQETIELCTEAGSDIWKRAQSRHSKLSVNLYAMMFCDSKKSKLGLAVSLIEFLCILDDIMEDLPQMEAKKQHELLSQVLLDEPVPEIDGQSLETFGLDKLKHFLHKMKLQIMSLSADPGLNLVSVLKQSLKDRESGPSSVQTLEEYLPHRVTNLDHSFVCQLLSWSMDIDLTEHDRKQHTLNQFEYAIGVIAGLVNDYFSWNMEKSQIRFRNAVPVLMKQYSITEASALSLLKDIITRQIHQQQSFKRELESTEISRDMKQYIEGLEHLAGGYIHWCAVCSRYRHSYP
ncbi:terpenoid synthase [Dendrothele bispora CBS 962.96]|uniref:Terpenoid synthase n=1 Tax=Dendrothele bispora (strain CBS 962.96) TaxID=1314807 RepID=A0A4S8KY02_DENBC|nr:terpenoid synthase [Dendrothele bispora CBS 962.96]